MYGAAMDPSDIDTCAAMGADKGADIAWLIMGTGEIGEWGIDGLGIRSLFVTDRTVICLKFSTASITSSNFAVAPKMPPSILIDSHAPR